MDFVLHIWRQPGPGSAGQMESHPVRDVRPGDTLLDVLDGLNAELTTRGARPVSFAEECRQGTCGLCALVINGVPHGPGQQKTTCQITMSAFDSGSTITLEPWRAGALPVIEDLSVDRGPLTRILDAASLPTSAAGANAGPQGVCIECGACAAACPNASAALFVGAKLKEHARRPRPHERVLNLVGQMDKEGFGACSSHGECAAACPKGIGLSVIAGLNSAWLRAAWHGPEESA